MCVLFPTMGTAEQHTHATIVITKSRRSNTAVRKQTKLSSCINTIADAIKMDVSPPRFRQGRGIAPLGSVLWRHTRC